MDEESRRRFLMDALREDRKTRHASIWENGKEHSP